MLKKIGNLFFALLVCLFIVMSFNTSSYAVEYDGGFDVTQWTTNVTIDENDCYHVEERIEVDFFESRHGIYRNIPTSGTLDRDGVRNKYRAKISNINVELEDSDNSSATKHSSKVKFDIKKSLSKVSIKVGDPDKELIGNVTYKISYDYDFGGDRLKDADEVYYNFIGDEWTSEIGLFEFDVTMPKAFDANNVGVKVGDDRINTFNVNERDGYHISGSALDIDYATPITIRVVLPDDYFEEATFFDNISLGFLLPVLADLLVLLFGFGYWLKSRLKKEKLYEPITLLPPKDKDGENYYAFELARIYDDAMTNEGLLSILFDLANEGYISIEQIRKKKYCFYKEKEYDGDNEILEMFFDALFSHGGYDSETNKAVVKTTQLRNTFYRDLSFMREVVDDAYSDVLYEPDSLVKSDKIRRRCVPLFIVSFILIVFSVIFKNVPIMLFSFPLILSSVFILSAGEREKKYCSEYKELRGRIGGFRTFLEKAEKPKLEMLIEENPNYFYDILPYAYALGVSKKYAKNFEGIAIEPPDYYRNGVDSFVATSFVNDLNSGLSTAQSSPSSSDSGGGSFSGGGGGGGGGGGSW